RSLLPSRLLSSFLVLLLTPPTSTLFPYTTLFRSIAVALGASSFLTIWMYDLGFPVISYNFWAGIAKFPLLAIPFFILAGVIMEKDRKSTRLNSSHVKISYAVFCLKKKKQRKRDSW